MIPGFNTQFQEEHEHWNFPETIQAVSQRWYSEGAIVFPRRSSEKRRGAEHGLLVLANLKKLACPGLIHIVVLLQQVASLQERLTSVAQTYLLLKAVYEGGKYPDTDEKISQERS